MRSGKWLVVIGVALLAAHAATADTITPEPSGAYLSKDQFSSVPMDVRDPGFPETFSLATPAAWPSKLSNAWRARVVFNPSPVGDFCIHEVIYLDDDQPNGVVVPEPASLLTLGTGLISLAALARRNQRRRALMKTSISSGRS